MCTDKKVRLNQVTLITRDKKNMSAINWIVANGHAVIYHFVFYYQRFIFFDKAAEAEIVLNFK